MAVFEHLSEIIVSVNDLVVYDLTVLFYRYDFRINESAVRFQTESSISFQHFFMKSRIDVYSIFHDKVLACLIVTF